MMSHKLVQPITNAGTPVLPPAPPPSLTYARTSLLNIARSSPSLADPPLLIHLASLPELIPAGGPGARHSLDSLLDEESDPHSIPRTLLSDTQPAPLLNMGMIDNFRIVSASESLESDNKIGNLVTLDFASLDIKPPVLIDFADPFLSSGTHQADKRTNASASDAFQPPLHRSSSADSETSIRAIRLGDSFSVLQSRSRSSSISSSFSNSPIMRKGSLCPWAAPYPLPNTTPILTATKPGLGAGSTTNIIPSLPLPKALKLPIGLPARPSDSLPPVFVKKESAILPQSMALPSVKPMGPEWSEAQTENVSGNELRRRRASEIGAGAGLGSLPLMRTGQSFSVARSIPTSNGVNDARFGSQSLGVAMGEKRPERLVKLGQSLRMSIAAKGQNAPAMV